MTDPTQAQANAQPQLPAALTGLIGHWHGQGVGGYPSLPEDFPFGQSVVIERLGPDKLSYVSRTWSLKDEHPMQSESGFFRWSDEGGVEFVVAQAFGAVEIFYGQIVEDAAGDGSHVELVTDLLARTTTAAEVTAEKRLYARRGEVLLYAIDMAAMGHPLQPHVSAALHPKDGPIQAV